MIKAKHTLLGRLFFKYFAAMQLNKYFEKVNMIGNYRSNGKSILMISNHFSWWDGFIQLYLNQKLLHKNFHVMMLEEQLLKFPILRKGGAFSVQKGTRKSIESIKYASSLLQETKNLVLIFPQGELQSHYNYPYSFEKGIQFLIKRMPADTQIVFNINLTDYWDKKKPTLNIYYKTIALSNQDEITIEELELLFNKFNADCIEKQINSNQSGNN